MVLFYLSLVAVGVIADCQDEILLVPDRMFADVGRPIANLADGRWDTYWRGDNTGGEYIYFYFSSEVEVKWIFIQRYYIYVDYVNVWDGATTFAYSYFGGTDEQYSSVTWRFNNVFTDMLRFYAYEGDTVPHISRLEVYGCYNTSTPTMSPTTSWPTDVPTSFPTVSPTLSPVTSFPSKIPSLSPTTAPTVSPSTVYPSHYPSTAPTRSPTVSPSGSTDIPSHAPTNSPTTVLPTNHPSTVPSQSPTLDPSHKTVIPSKSPTTSPTTMLPMFKPTTAPSPSPTVEPTTLASSQRPSVSPTASPTEPPTAVYVDDGFQITLGEIEMFLAAILCLCGVLMFVAFRYVRLMKMTENISNLEDGPIQIYNTDQTAEEKQKIEFDNDPNHNDANFAQRNTRTKVQSNKDVDTRFALGKVLSNNSGSCTPGKLAI